MRLLLSIIPKDFVLSDKRNNENNFDSNFGHILVSNNIPTMILNPNKHGSSLSADWLS
jgi:hypothetical protein